MHSFSILKSFQCVTVWPIRLNSSRPIDFVDAKNICSHAKFEMNLNNGRCSNLKIHMLVGIASIMPILNFITPVIWGKWSENKNKTKFRLRKVRSLPLTFDSKQIFTSCAREYVCVCVPMIPCSGIFSISAKHSLCIEILKAHIFISIQLKLDFSFNISFWKVLCGFIFPKYAMHWGEQINNISYWNGFFLEMCDLP